MKLGALLLLPLLTFALLVFVPNETLAKSGCCSGHGGVSCSAGPQADGTVVCNDGWRGSSCYYSEMIMCGGMVSFETPAPTPTATPIVTASPKPVLKATAIPSPTQSPTPTLAPATSTPEPTEEFTPSPTPEQATPTGSPKVQGQATQEPQVGSMTIEKEATLGDALLGFAILAGMVAAPVWVGKKIIRRYKTKSPQAT